MARPVVFNAQGETYVVLPYGVSVYSGTLLDLSGNLADHGAGRAAAFISLLQDTTGQGATIPVCRGGVYYDSDGPFHTGELLYTGNAGEITAQFSDTAQLIGGAVSSNYASIALTPAAGNPLAPAVSLLSNADQADLVDLLVALKESPRDFASLGELLEILQAARAPTNV